MDLRKTSREQWDNRNEIPNQKVKPNVEYLRGQRFVHLFSCIL